MKQELITIEDILKDTEKKNKGKYRCLFEKKKNKECEKDISLLNKILKDKLDAQRSMRGKVYSDSICGGDIGEKYGIGLRDISVDEYYGQHGLTYKRGYYVVDLEKKETIYSFGPSTYRGGHASDIDNWSIAYDEAKVLEEKANSVICGLKSRESLEIIEFYKDGKKKIIEEYDLKKEEKEKEKVNSVNKAIKELDEKSLETLLESIYGGYCKSKKLSDDIAFSMIRYNDRDYDGKVELVKFLVTIKDKGILELGSWHPNTYHPNFKFHEVSASLEDLKMEKKGKKVIITGRVEAWQIDYRSGWGYKDNKLQDKRDIKYEIELPD